MENIIVNDTHEVTIERLSDLLCTALDPAYGGALRWCRVVKKIAPAEWTYDSEPKPEGGYHWRQDYPLNEGGALHLVDTYNEETQAPFVLNMDAVKAGLETMLQKEPRHFQDFMEEQEDAITADVFIQCCMFGESIY